MDVLPTVNNKQLRTKGKNICSLRKAAIFFCVAIMFTTLTLTFTIVGHATKWTFDKDVVHLEDYFIGCDRSAEDDLTSYAHELNKQVVKEEKELQLVRNKVSDIRGSNIQLEMKVESLENKIADMASQISSLKDERDGLVNLHNLDLEELDIDHYDDDANLGTGTTSPNTTSPYTTSPFTTLNSYYGDFGSDEKLAFPLDVGTEAIISLTASSGSGGLDDEDDDTVIQSRTGSNRIVDSDIFVSVDEGTDADEDTELGPNLGTDQESNENRYDNNTHKNSYEVTSTGTGHAEEFLEDDYGNDAEIHSIRDASTNIGLRDDVDDSKEDFKEDLNAE